MNHGVDERERHVPVMPAQAGIQDPWVLGPGLRRGDKLESILLPA